MMMRMNPDSVFQPAVSESWFHVPLRMKQNEFCSGRDIVLDQQSLKLSNIRRTLRVGQQQNAVTLLNTGFGPRRVHRSIDQIRDNVVFVFQFGKVSALLQFRQMVKSVFSKTAQRC
ncbi:hypothetical protein OGAPHI_005616 [Ogataea philodendri]|uniref:Uncharacterized protein n=1 Tax=Ogataea philodendri TaxID=1378263 RepID=A0A9P8NZJ8_9ASCO|nr:uncharacterized protein OGAPHI_005616 [Ogataea philodendri]KAH3662364.1 hypothetical protein OGAPHI_005616 [Ogataea philodendri]